MMDGGPYADPIPARQQRTEATYRHADIGNALGSGRFITSLVGLDLP